MPEWEDGREIRRVEGGQRFSFAGTGGWGTGDDDERGGREVVMVVVVSRRTGSLEIG